MNKNPWLKAIYELINKTESNLEKIKNLIEKIWIWEDNITEKEISNILNTVSNLNKPINTESEIIVEWIFDGYNMIWVDSNKYIVPLNYSSKSKIIQWDH